MRIQKVFVYLYKTIGGNLRNLKQIAMKTLTIYENKRTGNLTCENEWVNVIEHKFRTLSSALAFISRKFSAPYSSSVFVFAFYKKSWNSTKNITISEVKKLFIKYTN